MVRWGVRQGEEDTCGMVILHPNHYLQGEFSGKDEIVLVEDVPAGGDIIHNSGKGLSAAILAAWYRIGCQVDGFVWLQSSTLSDIWRQVSRSTIRSGVSQHN